VSAENGENNNQNQLQEQAKTITTTPTHGQSISSSNISQLRPTSTDPRNLSNQRGQWFGSASHNNRCI